MPDTSGLPARRLTDSEVADLAEASKVSRTRSAAAWGEMAGKILVTLGKIAATA